MLKNDFFMEYKLDVKQPPPKLSLSLGGVVAFKIFIVKLTINRYYLKHYNFKWLDWKNEHKNSRYKFLKFVDETL